MLRLIVRLIPPPIRRLVLSRLRDIGWVIIRIPDKNHELRVEGTKSLQDHLESIEAPASRKCFGVKDPALRPYRIHMHHVGGRGGGFPFPIGPRFFEDVELYIYDADPGCRAQMEVGSNYVDHVITAAVAGADRNEVFHVTYDPYTSSLLSANEARRGLFFLCGEYDYVLEDVLKPVQEIPVAAESLDTLTKKHGSQIDYLSLDVQGAEYELLGGVSNTTLANTVAVMCEISFFQLYANQRLFDEITGMLRAKGFFMARLFPFGYDWATCCTGIGWRSEGFTGDGDALFFREITSISECAPDVFTSLMKAAFIAMCVGNISHAVQCLTEAYKNPASDVLAQAGRVGYIRFLDEMYRLYQAEPHIYPPRFRHVYSVDESLARFEVGARVVPDKRKVRKEYFAETDEGTFRRIAPALLSSSPTAFETLLRGYGFTTLADDVATKRVSGIKQVLRTLDISLSPNRS